MSNSNIIISLIIIKLSFNKQKINAIPIVIFLDIIWAIVALIFDYPVLSQIKYYYWPFIAICPIYPLLLAIIWLLIISRKSVNRYLLCFGVIPSIVYFIGAILYYPTWMFCNGFNFSALGQIFWVVFYGIQAFILADKITWRIIPSLFVSIFIGFSFYIQYINHSFGYFDYSNISYHIEISIYMLIVIISICYFILTKHFRK